MNYSTRFPLVLQAVVHSLPAPCIRGKALHERLGISLYSMKAIVNPWVTDQEVAIVIGPSERWVKADRANQLECDKAWRTLQVEYPQAAMLLLDSVPKHQDEFIRVLDADWDNPWAVGWHATKNWYWHIRDVFHVLDRKTELDAALTSNQVYKLRRFACTTLKGQQRDVLVAIIDHNNELPLETIVEICDWEDPYESSWNSLRHALNQKIHWLGWHIKTHNRAACIIPFDDLSVRT